MVDGAEVRPHTRNDSVVNVDESMIQPTAGTEYPAS